MDIKINDEKRKEIDLISAIANRAKSLNPQLDILHVMMDLSATHTINPLRLEDLLKSDVVNFSHDIYGITINLDRSGIRLLNCFQPRFTDYAKMRKI